MTTARKILIVDDDEDLRESLKDQLVLHDEFEVVTAPTASKGIDVARAEHLDLVLLDVGLPDMDGREACKLLRKSGFKSPIVMLTGNDSDADMILGLDSGATTAPGTWDDLAWEHLVAAPAPVTTIDYIDLNRAEPATGALETATGPVWHAGPPGGRVARGADHAVITLQRPVRVALYGADLLP